jgi:hypothetical protein
MAITSPQAVRFVNDEIRPMSERLRDVKAKIDSLLDKWTSDGISALIANDDREALEDGRDAEGVSRLNGKDVNQMVALLTSLQTRLNQAGTSSVISKPTVRQLDVGTG